MRPDARKEFTARSQLIHTLIHDLIYVDKPVTFPRDKTCTNPITGYADDLPIQDFPPTALISPLYEDRSTIHSLYDYE
jgi:hypothetical protein